jgi:predicted transcriptional regulator
MPKAMDVASVIDEFKSAISHIYNELHQLEQQVSRLEVKDNQKVTPSQDPIGIFKFKKTITLEKYLTKRGYEHLNGPKKHL